MSQYHPHETIRLDCASRHVYCRNCLRDLFVLSITDESLFPPKCCGSIIPVSLIDEKLTLEESNAFHDAETEYSTSNRVYCAQFDCGRFISMKDVVDDRAHCGACGNETCIHCKREAHHGDCPADEALQNLIAYAAEEHWQRCFGCGAMVERPEGCNHMT